MKAVGAKDGDVQPLGGDVVGESTLEFGPGGLSALGDLSGGVSSGGTGAFDEGVLPRERRE